ncbi:NAD-dependent epimerase/dehydratase family protein [Mesorhizobium sp. J428]|uniref:NAD-dependent epimerase/dehydratase family protein n=1 Tax=Mesorhizobium sp. J428 TaxID=2898440 RepID=UPI002150E41A|nr:NAD-dependent epimerase/dehydratase family protein [Mesorhizobium sp. J428]MCR5858809.1 NAD-dependent epimerase/dehydratase family protein [Mesorhizobium sp. J428]
MIGVYGADGFIGRHLVRRLIERGRPVRAVSRRFDRDFADEVEDLADLVAADLSQPLAMASSLQDVSTVVQLMSSSSPGLKNDHAVADITENVVPHVEFLQNCLRAGVKRYIFLSSGGTVYGPGAPVPTPETAPTNPINSHGLTKLFVEKYIQMHGHVDGLEYIILRVANPFGPGQTFRKGQGLVPAIIERWQKGQPVRIFGDGAARRDYIFISDVIDAIEAAIAVGGNPQHILNVGSGETRSINEVVEAIEAAAGFTLQREYVAARSTDVDVACLDISQARAVLGWTPKMEFRAGIATTVLQMVVDTPGKTETR